MPVSKIKTIAVIDYEAGNLFSVEKACRVVGLNPVVTNNIKDIFKAEALILPGVGAFGDAIKALNKLDLVQPLRDFGESGKPFMGICLGMQLLFSESHEFGDHRGLDIIKGQVAKFPGNNHKYNKIKVPHIGWNQILRPDWGSELSWKGSPIEAIQEGEYMYFIHSFYVMPESNESVLAITNYADIKFASAVMQKNIWGFQFHPEKSGYEGLRIYKNLKNIIDLGD